MPTQSEEIVDRNDRRIFQIFQNVQFNVVQHKKYIKELTKLYEKADTGIFRESFCNALQYVFSFGEANTNVDRIIQFVAAFCVSLDEEEGFLLFVFEIIFNSQCVLSQAVRYRASQLLSAVLGAMGDDASLDDDICEKLLASQIERLQDTRSCVRCRAALALQRLQNPADTDDPVTRAYRFHMSCDPSPSVRRAVVMSIAKCSRNAPHVMERLCDVDEAVRRAAFLHIAAINVSQLKVTQRVHILKVGLTERSNRVKKVVEDVLIPGWLSSFNGNILEMLTAVRLDNAQGLKDSHYVAGKLLESLFKRLQTSELLEWLPLNKDLRVIPANQLKKESAWYWRHLAFHLSAKNDDETLEAVMPDLPVLAGYIRAIVESPCPSEEEDPVGFGTRQYVLHELATMLQVVDVGDQVGRQAMQQLIFDVLTGDHGHLNNEVLEAFVKALAPLLPSVSERIEFLVSVIEQLREGEDTAPEQMTPPLQAPESTEIKMKRAHLRVELNVALEEQEEAAREQDYELASRCKEKVIRLQTELEKLETPAPVVVEIPVPKEKEKSTDPVVLNRCLSVINLFLDSPKITNVTPMLRIIFQELEVEIFQNPELLENAIQTVALYAMLDREMALEHKGFFFKQLVEHNMERPAVLALQSLIDLMLVHGVSVFQDKEKQDLDKEQDMTQNSHKTKKRLYDVTSCDEFADCDDTSLLLSPTQDTVIELLLNLMDSECEEYRLTVVVGVCRLVYLGRLAGGGLISRLLLLWFNPATASDDELRQTLGLFFQTFAETVTGSQEQIQAAVLPTLRALARAPASSPLADVDQDAVIKFIVSITRIDFEQGDNHGNLGMMLVTSLLDRLTSPEVPLICRCLSLLSAPKDVPLASDLARSLKNVIESLPDKTCIRYISKYIACLEAFELNSIADNSQTLGSIVGNRRTLQVRIEETIPEEVEIDETSPTDKIQEENVTTTPEEVPDSQPVEKKKTSTQKSKKERNVKTRTKASNLEQERQDERNQNGGESNESDADENIIEKKSTRGRKGGKNDQIENGGRSRRNGGGGNLRNKVDVVSDSSSTASPKRKTKKVEDEKSATATPAQPTRRSVRNSQRVSTRASVRSNSSDGDDTELHTIVYDDGNVQSILNDSSDSETKTVPSRSVVIPESPDNSDSELANQTKPKPAPRQMRSRIPRRRQ